jgi:isoamylase
VSTTRSAACGADPTKLLLDPYARAIEGEVDWSEHVFSYTFGDAGRQRRRAPPTSRCSIVVTNPYFDWGDDPPPRTSWHDTVIYEAHVRA